MADSMDELAGMLLTMLKDRKAVINAVIDNIQQVSTIKKGTERLLEQLDLKPGDPITDEVNPLRVCSVLTKSVNKLTQSTQQLLVFALLYVSEGNFDVDSALMMSKLGRGKEALRQMFKNKMKGG